MKAGDLVKSIDLQKFHDLNKKVWKIGIIISTAGNDGVLVMWQTGNVTFTTADHIWKISDERLQN